MARVSTSIFGHLSRVPNIRPNEERLDIVSADAKMPIKCDYPFAFQLVVIRSVSDMCLLIES